MKATVFEKLVAMVQFAKRSNLGVPAAFVEELIDACVLEHYFPEEALNKDLQFIAAVTVLLENTPPVPTEKTLHAFVEGCAARKLGEKLARLESASPSLFAGNQNEGKVWSKLNLNKGTGE